MEQNFPQPDKPHVIVLCPEGDLIRHEDTQFEVLLDEILDKGQRHFIIDFNSVNFIDSAGIGLIIKIAGDIAKHGGQLRLCNPKAGVKNVFRTLGIEDRFHIYPRLGEALRSIGELLSVEFVPFSF